jgi:hypothetical protein
MEPPRVVLPINENPYEITNVCIELYLKGFSIGIAWRSTDEQGVIQGVVQRLVNIELILEQVYSEKDSDRIHIYIQDMIIMKK